MNFIYRSLSTIPNRYAFLDRIDKLVAENEQVSLLLIDVVRFSDVSSSYGYEVGDAILAQVAFRIKNLFGEKALIGRISGDIFGLVLPGTHSDLQLQKFYAHLTDHFKTPITFNEQAFVADFNVGAVANNQGNRDITKLFSGAESALKQAKADKYKNFHVVRIHEQPNSGRALALKADLKRAINNDELELYFQPKVRLSDLTITGAECLLRWNHPLDGVIVPGVFIEAAESYNMMNELGYWVLEAGFRSAFEFEMARQQVQVSINISPTQLYDSRLLSKINDLATYYGIELSNIELELTEDVALSSSLMVKKQLSQLKATGMTIAVDDFGKGYSNLGYIRDIALDTIKIDKSFVMGLDTNPVNKAIIEATQVIANAKNCSVIAEGIETMEHLHVLREMGVQTGQGFLFSKAVTIADFLELTQSDLIVGDSLAYRNRVG
ncbi:Diguanylate cyclase VdcA [Saliniradius amylolyticus]|uniref:Diguanylate cyclase VdcA n=1 Tax=Saliniradius amylolyticus TaxID=2183582 RepID=A0A2S2E399_9ALTE|nr:bifunctional diguanylate cyclase/phosphodiesterase [Saliniradius amylolyticus]AWL12125.1 Diguanylate cyclase VdcA [Saliniradius amylolyticus]